MGKPRAPWRTMGSIKQMVTPVGGSRPNKENRGAPRCRRAGGPAGSSMVQRLWYMGLRVRWRNGNNARAAATVFARSLWRAPIIKQHPLRIYWATAQEDGPFTVWGMPTPPLRNSYAPLSHTTLHRAMMAKKLTKE